ncbi:hypothetical protein TPHA_0F03250 [Tetrapisispora phaffii CBS 4417]|uniref:Cytochrome c oxidase assembly protein CtaG/Cox11 n=1 Tax=Tetrapisispora phaffii (strain ATCC 24235 / CBS 4417 / NBRC 1672 / NRRL Y-8282 / UCD 70-5) TaxID=1071381 RepID=G8BUM0_TETPH|nr:hypothetical protein TPHA_0F03250 [Tetrapisispora phaffii CBS 4417]CCE63806.1 hypothetical protein TPHA_0F03250 [Tetrapisispora phaffii CBS 4417]
MLRVQSCSLKILRSQNLSKISRNYSFGRISVDNLLKGKCVLSTVGNNHLYSKIRLYSSNVENTNSTPFDTSKLTREELMNLYRTQRAKKQKFRDRTVAYYATSIAVVFLGLAYAAVPLYRAICARTGFGGIPITDRRKFTDDKMVPVDSDKRIRISFTSEVSKMLPWKFQPQQREVYVLPGETALAFYKAKNESDKDIIGMATYSITPGGAAPYFNKIQCFCFEEQKLGKGEEVDMPVFFFIDPDFATDPQMRNIDDIVLHYSFFKAHYSDGGAVSENDEPMTEGQKAHATLIAPPTNLVIDSVVENE